MVTRWLWVMLMTLSWVAVMGCSGNGISEIKEVDSLVVYSGRSASLVGPIIDQFRDSTDIDISVKYGSTAEMATTILEEGRNSPADVFFAQDPGGLNAISDMLSTLPDEMLTQVPQWARSPQSRWVGISGRARVIVYNTDSLYQNDLPKSLVALTDPEWEGRVGWAPSNGSFQYMVTAMRTLWGDRKTREWLLGMQSNNPQAYTKNTPIVAATASGEIDVGLVNHYYLYRFIQEDGEGFSARNHFLNNGGPGSIVMVAGAGILETSNNHETAQRFLTFLLSPKAQQYFVDQTYEYPLVEGVQAHLTIKPMVEINNPKINTASLSDLKGTQQLLRELGIIP